MCLPDRKEGKLMSQGTVLIQTDRCKGCALCVGVCPQHVLRLGEGYNARGYHPVQLDESAGSSTGCALCAVICPDVVFTVLRAAPPRPAQRPAAEPPGTMPPAIQPIPAQGVRQVQRAPGGANGHNGQNGHKVAPAAQRARA
jgi:2-oxoglutarate ferredoxin oxidoreductase subunit delta